MSIPLETAQEAIQEAITPISQTHILSLLDARSFVCAHDVYAPIDSPPFDRSPMDGFALCSRDTQKASLTNPAAFRIVGTIYAGEVFHRAIGSFEALRIMTGAAMPSGADCMVPKENVVEKADCLMLSEALQKHQNYIFRAEEYKSGQLLIKKETKLNASHLAVLASCGFGSIEVFKMPVIAFMSTGDELLLPSITPVEGALVEGKIYNSNETMIAARIAELGLIPKVMPVAKDNAESAAAIIDANIEGIDIFITSGGVSVGDKDIMHEVFTILGAKTLFWRISCKPGGAALFGTYRGKLLACLSGPPFAAFANFELLVRPAIAILSHRSDLQLVRKKAYLETAFVNDSKGRRLLRAKYNPDLSSVTLCGNHSSSQLLSLMDCNCLVDIAGDGKPLTVGSQVDVVLLSGWR
ncbi:MAG: molybdopterin molybdotransferase MoeA [Termitinemataceae bacterium]|nr:MAG: molybdopterin molybdotransferase MoeA [Termitinemataceae bacterium]